MKWLTGSIGSWVYAREGLNHMAKFRTYDHDAIARLMLEDGLSPLDAARAAGCGRTTVHRVMRKCGIMPPRIHIHRKNRSDGDEAIEKPDRS